MAYASTRPSLFPSRNLIVRRTSRGTEMVTILPMPIVEPLVIDSTVGYLFGRTSKNL